MIKRLDRQGRAIRIPLNTPARFFVNMHVLKFTCANVCCVRYLRSKRQALFRLLPMPTMKHCNEKFVELN